jgi:hypothetical protein
MAEWEFFSEESMYQEIKSEQYSNFGGINTKVSTYITGLNECLDLKNFDFSQPGSYTTRWGSTQFIGLTVVGRILGTYDFETLTGPSYIVLNTPTEMWYTFGGSSYYPVFMSAEGVSYSPTLSSGQTIYIPVGASPNINNFDSNLFCYRTFVNSLFLSNGSSGSFQKFMGETLPQMYGIFGNPYLPGVVKFSYLYGLPSGITNIGATTFVGAGFGSTGATGVYYWGYGWLDIYGYRSAPSTIGGPFNFFGGGNVGISLAAASMTVLGGFISSSLIPWDYGVTSISLYLSNPNGSELFLYEDIPLNFAFNIGPTLHPTINDSFARPDLAEIAATYTIVINPITIPNTFNAKIPAEFPLFFTLSPKFLEIYNNEIFMAGFTSYPQNSDFGTILGNVNYQSTLFWTEVGEPEFIDPDFFDEVRTDDGDRITGLKAYRDTLLIFKKNSFHVLNGNSATDINITEISDQYGCMANKCVVVYNLQCLFLDRKGIMRWDGANLTVASDKIEPLFYRMNIDAALDSAVGFHFKKRNECWFCIPVDGSTQNNLAIVYNYVTDSWTTFNGFFPSDVAIARGYLSDYTGIYGSYSGAIFNFGQSLTSDNGTGITTFLKTTFYREEGNSITKQWRRLYIDSDILAFGATLQVDMIPDHGTSIYATRYILAQPFQTRIDFGIPAKAMQFQFTYCNATLPIRINGLTVEHRFQRSV